MPSLFARLFFSGVALATEAQAQPPNPRPSSSALENAEGAARIEKEALEVIRSDLKKDYPDVGAIVFATHQSHPDLMTILEKVQEEAAPTLSRLGYRSPNTPKIIIYDHPEINGADTKPPGMGGPYMLLSTGALTILSHQELEAHVRHEYAHAVLNENYLKPFEHYRQAEIDKYLDELVVQKKITFEQRASYAGEFNADGLAALFGCNPEATQSMLQHSEADWKTRFLQTNIQTLMQSDSFRQSGLEERGKMLSTQLRLTREVLQTFNNYLGETHPPSEVRERFVSPRASGLPGCAVLPPARQK